MALSSIDRKALADVRHFLLISSCLSNTFKLKSFDTFWLSETPFDISQANETGNFRICGTAVLETGEPRRDSPCLLCRTPFVRTAVGDITVMSTHWDHESDYAVSASQRSQHISILSDTCDSAVSPLPSFDEGLLTRSRNPVVFVEIS